MKQNQQQDKQQQYQEQNQGQGERRHAPHGDYHGGERRKPDPMEQMPGGNPQGGNPGMSTQDRKQAQQKKQQEGEHKSD